jgi:catalase
MLNTPIFGAANPQTFLDMMLALRPDPTSGKPDPEKIRAFRASHPDNEAQAHFLETFNPPNSYANSAYFGIHTFKFINRRNKATFVRWQFVPQDGEKRLSDDELKNVGPDFLEGGLITRTGQGPVRWDMVVSIGQPGDPEDNPTIAWPDARLKIKVGTLSIRNAMPQHGAECEKINFDPLVMADGIAPSNDPVLMFRSPAYSASFGKRLGGL